MPLRIRNESASPVKVTLLVLFGERATGPLAVKVLPVLTVKLLLTWVKPDVLPIAIVPVALPPKLMDVAVVLNKLAVVLREIKSDELAPLIDTPAEAVQHL